jgi:hypothetical protein
LSYIFAIVPFILVYIFFKYRKWIMTLKLLIILLYYFSNNFRDQILFSNLILSTSIL